MRRILRLFPSDARHVPWKNGRGFTEELALWPEEASFERDDYDWRISKARVDAGGPFSRFPGIDRILVVTEGPGILLTHGEGAQRVRVRRLEPHRFAGDGPATVELVGAQVVDLNVFARRGRIKASVEVLALGKRRAREEIAGQEHAHAFLHVLAGALVARVTREEEPFALAAGDSLWCRELGSDEELELAGNAQDALALLVRLNPGP